MVFEQQKCNLCLVYLFTRLNHFNIIEIKHVLSFVTIQTPIGNKQLLRKTDGYRILIRFFMCSIFHSQILADLC